MKSVGTTLVFLISIVLPFRICVAVSNSNSARAVLEKYLDLDAHAVGISAATWPQMSPYTTWEEFSNWDTLVIVNDYRIDKFVEGHTRALATVTYHDLGKLSDKFVPNTIAETVTFHLNNVNGQWKVDGPQTMPHVDFSVMKNRLEKNAPNATAKKINEALVAQIEQARHQSPSAPR